MFGKMGSKLGLPSTNRLLGASDTTVSVTFNLFPGKKYPQGDGGVGKD